MIGENVRISPSLSLLSHWFRTMQLQPGAYGGPVVHWWACSFIHCGSGINWTYEGLIEAYVRIHQKTKDDLWLSRAVESAEYIRKAQLPDGTYKNSFFENNPIYGSSSVHEAGADLGLMCLASHLENLGEEGEKFVETVKRNAEKSMYQRLWNPSLKLFRSTDDTIIKSSYVLNIMATVAQVFLRLYSITKEDKYQELVETTLSFLLRNQRKGRGSVLFGSFPQARHDANAYALYNARILNFLIEAYEVFGEERVLESAEHCGTFLRAIEKKGGGFSFFVDRKGEAHDNPNLIGGVAETVRALLSLRDESSVHAKFDEKPHIGWLLKFQDSIGGFRTAVGFHYDVQKTDYKDVFHVCGWNDKVFRLLASLFQGNSLKENLGTPMKEKCWIGNTQFSFAENDDELTIQDEHEKPVYSWTKEHNLSYVDRNFLKYFARVSPAQSISGYDVRSLVSI